jgi:hypothetical protein
MSAPPAAIAPSKIHDVVEVGLPAIAQAAGEERSLLEFGDHWLRRFGAARILRASRGAEFSVLRQEADEVWAVVEGSAEVDLVDERRDSPTQGLRDRRRLVAPMRLLVPFGVRASLRASGGDVILVRLMSHSLDEDPNALGASRGDLA